VDPLWEALAAPFRPGPAQLHLHIVGDSTTELVLDAGCASSTG
jgi:hypothetical protein